MFYSIGREHSGNAARVASIGTQPGSRLKYAAKPQQTGSGPASASRGVELEAHAHSVKPATADDHEVIMPRHKSKPDYIPGSHPDDLHAAFDAFLLDREATGVSAATLRSYRNNLIPFIDWCLSHAVDSPRAITVATIQKYTVEKHAHNKPSTRKISNVIVKLFLHFCLERGLIEHCPVWKLPKALQDGVDRPFLTGEQVEKVEKVYKAATRLVDRCLVATLADSGIRRCEAVGLTWEHVDLTTGQLTISHGKGNKNRAAFVGAFTRELLAELKAAEGGGGAVFLNRSGRPLDVSSLSRRLERLGNVAGVKLSSHRLRRSYGVLATVNGMSPFLLQDSMGHASIEQTRQYVKLATEHLRAAHAAASPMDHLNGNAK